MKITEKELMNMVMKERIVTSSEVAEKFGISWNTAEKYLLEMLIEGRVERIKKVGVTLWVAK